MKVVHISTPVSFRGGEQQVLYLIEALAELSVDQELWCPEKSELARRVAEMPVALQPLRNRILAAFDLRSCYGGEGDIVLHAHDSHAHTVAWLAALGGLRVPLVVSRRVARAPKASPWSWGKYQHPSLRALLCVSEHVAALHRGALRGETAVEVVYSAAAAPASHPPALREELGLPEQAKLIGTVAALTSEKDFPTFVKTCEALHRADSTLHFIHIGTGSEAAQQEAERLRRAAGLEDRLHLLGFRADAPALIGAFDVFVFTTRWEGLGSSILQAQWREVPVVSTRAGGTPELVAHEVTGLLAEVGEWRVLAKAVHRLLEDHVFAKRLTNAARLQAAQFTTARMAQETLVQYRKALAIS